jgi:hypothetical protein
MTATTRSDGSLDELDVSACEHAKRHLATLGPWAKMIEYNKAMLFYREYAGLRPQRMPFPLFMLDNVNYSSTVVPDPLPLSTLLDVFRVEPGYATVTGDTEIGPVVRAVEAARARHNSARGGREANASN